MGYWLECLDRVAAVADPASGSTKGAPARAYPTGRSLRAEQ